MTTSEAALRIDARKARQFTTSRDERIRALRAEGYSLRRIAELCDLSHTAIRNICERG